MATGESPKFKYSENRIYDNQFSPKTTNEYKYIHINIKIENNRIKRVASAKSLGVTVDERLSWDKHIDEKSKKLAAAIGSLKRVRPFISTASATLIYQALIQPHFDYCSSVWDRCSAKLSDKMQKLQNRAARIITKSNYDSSATQLLESLHWDDLSKRRKKTQGISHI